MKTTTILRNTFDTIKCVIVVVEICDYVKTLVTKYKKPKKVKGFNNSGKEEKTMKLSTDSIIALF